MEKYKNKYRKESIRAAWWDYSWTGAYFITVNCKNHRHYLGKVINKKMVLSPLGVLADVFWHEIPKHSLNVELGVFSIMPSHMHGILIIRPPKIEDNNQMQTKQPNLGATRFQNQGKNSISSMVGSYKSAVTRHANRLGLKFAWQTGFHEHIIRNFDEYHRIHKYITDNPAKWSASL